MVYDKRVIAAIAQNPDKYKFLNLYQDVNLCFMIYKTDLMKQLVWDLILLMKDWYH